MIEVPLPDKVLIYDPVTYRKKSWFRDGYQPLDPFDENQISDNARRMDREWLKLVEEFGPMMDLRSTSSLHNNELYSVELRSGNQYGQDFVGRPALLGLNCGFLRNEFKQIESIQEAIDQHSYTIYQNGNGIYQQILKLCFVSGNEHFSVLKQRFMNIGDFQTVEELKKYFIS